MDPLWVFGANRRAPRREEAAAQVAFVGAEDGEALLVRAEDRQGPARLVLRPVGTRRADGFVASAPGRFRVPQRLDGGGGFFAGLRRARVWPTLGPLHRLVFFPQVGAAQPRVDPDGRVLCYASRADPEREPGVEGPVLYRLDLDEGEPSPRRLLDGHFATFTPHAAGSVRAPDPPPPRGLTMPLLDRLGAALSAPAGRVVEGSVRAIVAELLQERGYASPAEVLALREELAELRARMQRLEGRVEALRARMEALEAGEAVAAGEARDASEAGGALAAGGACAPAEAGPAEAAASAGWSRNEQERWRAGGQAGRIGPEGYLEIDGQAAVVDPSLEGRPYESDGLDAGEIRVDGRVLRPVPLPLPVRDGGPRSG